MLQSVIFLKLPLFYFSGESNNGPKSEIENSKSEVSDSRKQIIETDRTINTPIISKVDQLYAKVKDLEQCLYPKGKLFQRNVIHMNEVNRKVYFILRKK